MKILLSAVLLAAFAASPASAAKMQPCTGEALGKSITGMGTVDSPAKQATAKEMAAANTELSKGNAKGACKHYMKAQKMSAK
ncbi:MULTISPECIES: hypothetical protein [Bradyrhizobium]|jgi:hypothetical protein|uniref:hypothetical protein n=1 Tax=Bradyrhizobium TaxID=374 RepID=UPI001BA45124|nr:MULTISPECIES: hypothetical protein [Bradyrhizobium]MBR0815406.1 hypothetical protein [Bradyrhizobium diazoefficiens]WOH75246.1 hypothetical protein RX330_09020 [Bradyrhizobium sp. NDS-1]